MLKQSPGRNQRSKGFKVKHVLQICLLLAICIWLLYQVKHSHDKNKAYEDSSLSAETQNGHDIIKLGRRDLHPRVDTPFKIEKHEEEEEYSKEEVEGSKLEESDTEDVRGGGDDEIDGHDQERAEEEESEEVEDLIDEEDRESEDKGIDFDDVKSLEDQTENEGKSNSQEAREENYKDDDASSAVMHNVQTISRSLRKVKEETVESADKDEVEKEIETYHSQDFLVGTKDSVNKVHRSLTAKSFASENAGEVKEDGEFDSSHSDNAMYSTSLLKAESNELTKMNNESIILLLKEPTSLNGTNKLPELISAPNLSSAGRDSFTGTVLGKTIKNPEKETYSNLTPSVFEDSDAVKKGKSLNGSESILAEGILQFGAETQKSSATETTDENSLASGESKMNDGLHSGDASSKTLASNENLGAVEESSDSADFSFYQEDKKSHSILSSL